MKRRYILLLSALVLFTGAVIMTGCPSQVKPQTPKYKVTLNSGKHGSVTVKPALPADGMVEAHTRLSFTAQPDEGYKVDTWIMAAPRSADKKEAALTVAEKTTVTVTFKPKIKKYKIMLNKNEYGTVTVHPILPADGMIEQYKTLTFTATPNEGYEVEWTGAAPDNADKNKATLTVTADAVVTATFKKPGNSAEVQNCHVALSSGNNGTLIADTPLPADGMVAAGSTLTFTATPDFDYEVERWTGAVPDPSDSTKATLTVTAHTTISVTANVTLLEIDSTGKVIKGSPELDGYLILPDTVTSINDHAFYNCRRLTGITIPDSVNKIGESAFQGCNRLKTVIIGNNVHEIGKRAFADCARLTNLTIGTGVTSIKDYVFWKCEDLITITIPDNVVSIGSNVFESCSRLTSVTIGSGVTSMADKVFEKCNKLKTVVIKGGLTRIAARTFYECKSLTNITLPNSIREIEERDFAGCTELTSIVLPNSIRKIGPAVFGGCQNLKSVKFENTSGWQYQHEYATSSQSWSPITQTDVADTLIAARYLCNTYCQYYWRRLY